MKGAEASTLECGRKRRWLRLVPTVFAAASVMMALGCTGDSTGSADIRLVPHTFVDLGAVAPGKHTVRVGVRNGRAEPVRVTRFTTSCGCANLSFESSRPLASGETREASFDITVEQLSARSAVALFYVESGPVLTFTVTWRGTKKEGLEFDPVVELGRVAVGEVRPFTVTVHRTRPREASSVVRGPGELAWKVEPGKPIRIEHVREEPGDDAKSMFRVVVAGELVPRLAGRGQAGLLGHVDDAKCLITVTWVAERPVLCEPASVTVLRGESTNWTAVKASASPGWRIVRVESPDSNVEFEVESMGADATQLRVRPRSALWAGTGVGELHIVAERDDDSTQGAVPIRSTTALSLMCGLE